MRIDPGFIIPMLALSIPLAVVVGRHIVRPLAEALMRTPTVPTDLTDREAHRQLEELRDRLDGLEKTLARVEEEQAFQHALQTGETLAGPHELPPVPGKMRRV